MSLNVELITLACLIAVASLSLRTLVMLPRVDRWPHAIVLIGAMALGLAGSFALKATLIDTSTVWTSYLAGPIAGLALAELGPTALEAVKSVLKRVSKK